MLRCSQPAVGLTGKRCSEDEHLFEVIQQIKRQSLKNKVGSQRDDSQSRREHDAAQPRSGRRNFLGQVRCGGGNAQRQQPCCQGRIALLCGP